MPGTASSGGRTLTPGGGGFQIAAHGSPAGVTA